MLRLSMAAILGSLLLAATGRYAVQAQSEATETPTPGGSQPYITNTYLTEPSINVRSGPSTVDYDIIGTLPQGATAPALGKSPGGNWIEIAYPPGPGGVGWIYAANVTLSPGFLKIIEPPPTATPPATATIDPTFEAQFNLQPTATRLPTFTPSAPIVVPTFSNVNSSSTHFPIGVVIVVVGLIGMFIFLISLFGRR